MRELKLHTDKMKVKVKNGVGWMIFNQPEKRNAVSFDMWQSIPKIVNFFESNNKVRVVVMRGAGNKAFVSGADISEFEDKRNTKKQVEIYDKATENASNSLINLEKPLISMINGFCIGGGLALSLCSDIRITSQNGLFAVPAAKLGVGYKFSGIKQLMDLVGPSYTKEIFFTGRKFTSNEALKMGLVNDVVKNDELDIYIDNLTNNIVENAPLTIRSVKVSVNEGLKIHQKSNLEKVNKLVEECFSSEDYMEGRRAFMEKRKPRFGGK